MWLFFLTLKQYDEVHKGWVYNTYFLTLLTHNGAINVSNFTNSGSIYTNGKINDTKGILAATGDIVSSL